MNTSKIFTTALIAIASLSAASVFASDSDYPGAQPNSTVSITTRAQVRAEYLQAKREGTLIGTGDDYPVVAAKSSGKTRGEVTAEYLQAKREGTLIGTDDDYPVVAAKSSDKTRAERKAELADVQRAGYLTRSDNS